MPRITKTEAINALGKEIEGLRSSKVGLQAERDQLVRQNDDLRRRLEEEQDYATVLASDRDRLTAALEVYTRRFASPNAERLLARAGWRANSLVSRGESLLEPQNQKAEHSNRLR